MRRRVGAPAVVAPQLALPRSSAGCLLLGAAVAASRPLSGATVVVGKGAGAPLGSGKGAVCLMVAPWSVALRSPSNKARRAQSETVNVSVGVEGLAPTMAGAGAGALAGASAGASSERVAANTERVTVTAATGGGGSAEVAAGDGAAAGTAEGSAGATTQLPSLSAGWGMVATRFLCVAMGAWQRKNYIAAGC